MSDVLFAELTDSLAAVAATRSRNEKTAAVASVLRRASVEEAFVAASYLSGRLRQRRTGVAWRSLRELPEPAASATLAVLDVDDVMQQLAEVSGVGSVGRRAGLLNDLFARATSAEQALLRGLIVGEVRTGALEGVFVDALAAAYDAPKPAVRRAVMLAGSAPAIAEVLARGESLDDVRLEVLRPVQPMLASSAPSVAEAVATAGLPCVVDGKLDGIRIQVHRSGDEVSVFSRSLDDITARLPSVVALARSLDVSDVVLDGEALLVDASGRPGMFQDSVSADAALTPYFFDVVHLDGCDLHDAPLSERMAVLAGLVPAAHLVPRLVASTREEAEEFNRGVLDAGQEGVVIKSWDSTWEAGRRGGGWIKVKPVHTLDLVVLAVEWGSGRRRGMLSNIHLGARDPSAPTGFVMLGKTFKGMTDEMLAWQTERFLSLETHRDEHVVQVRPEQVVEIAFDGVQRSSRYPGGVALRFARVVRYREDKSAEDADTIDAVRRVRGG